MLKIDIRGFPKFRIMILISDFLHSIWRIQYFCLEVRKSLGFSRNKSIWGVSRQLPQRAARESQIVLFLTHDYDTKMYLKKWFDKRFRRIFSSAFQWCRQFFRNFTFWSSKTLSNSISRRKHLGHSLENILSYVKNAQLSI